VNKPTSGTNLSALFTTDSSNDAVEKVIAPLIVQLNDARARKTSGWVHLLRLFVIPMAAAFPVAMIGILTKAPPDQFAPVPGVVFIITAVVVTIMWSRRARRKRYEELANLFAVDIEHVVALEKCIVRDAKLIARIQETLQSMDGYPMSSNLNTRVIEAIVAALVKTDLLPLIEPRPEIDEQLEKAKKHRETIQSFSDAHPLNNFVTSGMAVFVWVEDLLRNRQEIIAVCRRVAATV